MLNLVHLNPICLHQINKKCSRPVPEEIDEADSDATVHVEDEVGFLLGGDLLDLPGVVQQRGAGEVFFGELGHKSYPLGEGNYSIHKVP